jgi:hypothetical protein
MSEDNCGYCKFPITRNDIGIRYFGFFRAHQETECIRLFKVRITELEAEGTKLREQARPYETRIISLGQRRR